MAETIAHDVVKEAQSVGSHHQPSDDSATTSNEFPAGNGQATTTTNDLPSTSSNAQPSDADGVAATSVAAGVDSAMGGPEEALAGSLDGAAASGPALSESVAQALADASGGSDTDTSKNDAADLSKDGKGHIRTGSVKKPASFKPVSVTKSFLAKSLSSSPAPRPGDKGIASAPSPVSALQSAKPRLVAKSALGGTGKGLTKLNGTGGPDASKVWNKNRPAPAPAPRQFTDEELQTRYGIHMTARLQSDEPGKDSKWADIDDDEDDWAPETVEWMDGTKSNVGATEAQLAPPRQEDRVPSPATVGKPNEAVKPVLTSMHKPNVSQTTKTILRPGAQLSASPKPGSAPKSGLEKGAPGSSKPAPPPTKSPWAVLPPVERIAPINPPIQQASRPFQRDPQGFDAMPPAPSPAQEIAADDFSRSFGGERGTRELFNAQSGRYEPASEARRGSRQEQGYRQPAVLQRPSQGGMPNGPAEPSAAFQTHRSSIEGGAPWQRRRASSSLSAAGGRRPSFAGSQEFTQGPHNDIAVESPKVGFASLDRPGPWTRHQQPPSEPPLVENEAAPEVPQQPMEDPVAKQQRMMKEKIERARAAKQKQLEEEEAEKVARQERLKKKMEELAGAAPSPDTAVKGAGAVSAQAPAPTQPPKANAVSPPKPPVPTSEGEVAQYGMMKVHQPHPVKKNFVSEASLTSKAHPESGHEQAPGYRGSVSPNKSAAGPSPSQPHQHTAPGERLPPKGLPNAPAGTAPLENLGGSWKTSPSPNDYNWNASTIAPRSAVSSVWGPPLSNEKSLGNGTFESKFSHPNFSNRLDNRFDNSRGGGLPAQGPLHGPIGSGIKGAHTPPSSSQRQSNFATTFQNLAGEKSAQQEQLAPSKPSQSPSVDDQAFASAHLDSSLQQSIAQSSSLHPQTAAPLAHSAYPSNNMSSAQVALPPSSTVGKSLGTHGQSRDWLSGGGTTTAGWKNFHSDETKKMNDFRADYKAVKPTTAKAPTNETYDIYREGSMGQVEHVRVVCYPEGKIYRVMITGVANPHSAALIQESMAKHPEDFPAAVEQTTTTAAAPQASTSSRFFSKGQATAATSAPPAINVQLAHSETDAPPPAEQGLFEHDATQPAKVKFPIIAKVNLPGMRIPLPPRSPGFDKTFNSNNVFPPTGPSRGKVGGVMHAADLEARFAHLRTGGVSASTKPSFDITSTNAPTSAVHKPRNVAPATAPKPLFSTEKSSATTSKPIAEEDCIDFPDFGSKPAVRVPTVPHKNHHLGYSHHSEMLTPSAPRLNARFQKVADITSKNAFIFDKEDKALSVKLPGMENVKKVDVQNKRFGGRFPANGPIVNGAGFRGGRGSYATRGARGDHGFALKFGGRNGQGRDGNAGPAAHRGGRGRGGASAGSSGTSSPKSRGQWAPCGGQGGHAGQEVANWP